MIGPSWPGDTLRGQAPDSRPGYVETVNSLDLLATLAEFDPHIAGTPLLNLDIPTSDIDILCYAPDPWRFTSAVWRLFGTMQLWRR
ncbi:DUF4269 domain-containing protein, partial [Novosphingobium sp. AP12]|uniref:DUF4269 domain-containing protein n=1 Tax=Novosphingobium sp. AP12 TaxID=1144305 RepID=UPI00027223CB